MRRAILFSALLGLAACASNPYRDTYTSQLSDKVPLGEPASLLPAQAEPQLLSSQDMKADAIKLLEQGYRPIGRSKFQGTHVDASAAVEQARAVGADVVVVRERFLATNTYAQPVGDWTPDRQIVTDNTTVTRNQAAGSPDQVQTQTQQSVTTIEGEYQVHYEPVSYDTYEQTASYWRRAPAPTLGLLVSELGDAERKAIQSNKGVLVKAVVRKSPAFLADCFRGDIVRQLGDHEVLGADDFFEAVQAQAGKSVALVLWRDGKTLNKTVTLAR
jgi:C-terminal processing protease CtpA/Prc